MKRVDHEYLKLFAQRGGKWATYADIPLIHIPQGWMGEGEEIFKTTKEMHDKFVTNAYENTPYALLELLEDIPEEEILVFNDSKEVIAYDGDDSTQNVPYFKVMIDTAAKDLKVQFLHVVKNNLILQVTGRFNEETGGQGTLGIRALDEMFKQVYKLNEQTPIVDAHAQDMANMMELAIRNLTIFLYKAKTSDKYLIKQQKQIKFKNKAQEAKNRRKMHARSDLITLIYLDSLPTNPSVRKDHQGGTHASPRIHRRKGVFYTMRSDKYKNHPNYMKVKANYRKAAWVGDRERVIDGVTYTVHERPPNKPEVSDDDE